MERAIEKTERAIGSVRPAEFVVLRVPEPASVGRNVNVTVLLESTGSVMVAGVKVPESVQVGVMTRGADKTVPAVGVTLKMAFDPTDREVGPVSV